MTHSNRFHAELPEFAVRRYYTASWIKIGDKHRDIEGRLLVPPMMLGSISQLYERPHALTQLGFAPNRSFHGSEEIHLFKPLIAGDTLEVVEQCKLLSNTQGRRSGSLRRGLMQNTLSRGGEIVGYVQRMILEAERVAPPIKGHDSSTIFSDGLAKPKDPLMSIIPALTPSTAPEVAPNASFGPLTRTDFVRFTAASGDLTSIHFDDNAAADGGWPAPFAMGMLSAAFIGNTLASWTQLTYPCRILIRFVDQTWPGEVLDISGYRSNSATLTFLAQVGSRKVTTCTVEFETNNADSLQLASESSSPIST